MPKHYEGKCPECGSTLLIRKGKEGDTITIDVIATAKPKEPKKSDEPEGKKSGEWDWN